MRRRVKKEKMKRPDDIGNDGGRSVSSACHDTAWCDTGEWLRMNDDHEWFEDAKTQSGGPLGVDQISDDVTEHPLVPLSK
jgi:hypothetical protein